MIGIDKDAFWVLIAKLGRATPGADYEEKRQELLNHIDQWAAETYKPQPPSPLHIWTRTNIFGEVSHYTTEEVKRAFTSMVSDEPLVLLKSLWLDKGLVYLMRPDQVRRLEHLFNQPEGS